MLSRFRFVKHLTLSAAGGCSSKPYVLCACVCVCVKLKVFTLVYPMIFVPLLLWQLPSFSFNTHPCFAVFTLFSSFNIVVGELEFLYMMFYDSLNYFDPCPFSFLVQGFAYVPLVEFVHILANEYSIRLQRALLVGIPSICLYSCDAVVFNTIFLLSPHLWSQTENYRSLLILAVVSLKTPMGEI